MSQADYDELVVKAAEKFRLDVNLLRAIISTESNWDPWAMRFEPTCTYSNEISTYSTKNGLTYSTEEVLQHSSFGLMQVMGVLARDLGFTDKLTMLCDPNIGLFYGCKQLRRLMDKYGNEPDVIAAYNAGSARKTPGGMYVNQNYVNKVYSFLVDLRKLN